jgi:hypothetical protein
MSLSGFGSTGLAGLRRGGGGGRMPSAKTGILLSVESYGQGVFAHPIGITLNMVTDWFINCAIDGQQAERQKDP